MHASIRARRLHYVLLAAVLLLVSQMSQAFAQSGSRFQSSVTFANSATATLKFSVPSLLVDPNAPPSTSLLLEFGKDGSTTPLDPQLANTVTFTLKMGGQNALPPFAINALPSGQVVLNNTKQISMSKPNPAGAPGLYKLDIVHLEGSANTEAWELAIAGLPTGGSPTTRANAALSGAHGGFTDLAPAGVCGASQPCPPTRPCPIGESCQPDVYRPWFEWDRYVFIPRWPFPDPNPCLTCPPDWRSSIPDGYDRALLAMTPRVAEGKVLGAGHGEEIAVEARNAELIGGVVDVGNGQYLQVIQFRQGDVPEVTAMAAGVPAEPLQVETPESVRRSNQTTIYALGAALVLSLVANAFLAMRARRR